MRALLPEPSPEVDLAEAYALPPSVGNGAVFVRCNMVMSLDGAATVGGRSGPLSSPADRRLFATLRSMADVILVGAGTVRAEHYGPARLDDEARQARLARGQRPVPPMAVVSGSADLDWSSPFFTAAEERPIVFTTKDGQAKAPRSAKDVARFVVAGRGTSVGPSVVAEQLHREGHNNVLLEGGPRLAGQFVGAGLVDELCLTVAPRLVAGPGGGILNGGGLPHPLEVFVLHLLEEDGFCFYRVALRRPRPAGAG
jgi:riboflavin biosynthesis pyrimidine reductase